MIASNAATLSVIKNTGKSIIAKATVKLATKNLEIPLVIFLILLISLLMMIHYTPTL